jgi:hypothetical protein
MGASESTSQPYGSDPIQWLDNSTNDAFRYAVEVSTMARSAAAEVASMLAANGGAYLGERLTFESREVPIRPPKASALKTSSPIKRETAQLIAGSGPDPSWCKVEWENGDR